MPKNLSCLFQARLDTIDIQLPHLRDVKMCILLLFPFWQGQNENQQQLHFTFFFFPLHLNLQFIHGKILAGNLLGFRTERAKKHSLEQQEQQTNQPTGTREFSAALSQFSKPQLGLKQLDLCFQLVDDMGFSFPMAQSKSRTLR